MDEARMDERLVAIRPRIEARLRKAAAAHIDSRSNQRDSEAIGELIDAAQAAAMSGMSLREIAMVIDSGAREHVTDHESDFAMAHAPRLHAAA